jgi:hypothetical protein
MGGLKSWQTLAEEHSKTIGYFGSQMKEKRAPEPFMRQRRRMKESSNLTAGHFALIVLGKEIEFLGLSK